MASPPLAGGGWGEGFSPRAVSVTMIAPGAIHPARPQMRHGGREQPGTVRRIEKHERARLRSGRRGERVRREHRAAIARTAGCDIGAQHRECGAVLLDERRVRSPAGERLQP